MDSEEKNVASYTNIEDGLAALPPIPAPHGFTSGVMGRVPRKVAPSPAMWWRRAAAIAALWLLLGVPMYVLTADARPMVESSDPGAGVQLRGDRAILPTGATLRGDLRVYNAELYVAGRIEGTVYLADSNLVVGAGGEIVGEVKLLPHTWLTRLRIGLAQAGHEARAHLRGVLR